MIHRKRSAVALIVLMCCFSLYGCPFLVVTGAAVAGGTGTYYYVEGEMRTDYYFSVDGVWSGVEKTIADMKGRDVEPDKQPDGGKIVAVTNRWPTPTSTGVFICCWVTRIWRSMRPR